MKPFFFLFLLFFYTSSSGQIITTVAGEGTYGYSGDGGPALNARLGSMYYTYPAFDNLGNMYIAQNTNNTIRKIDPSGTITTIAGQNGVIGYSGDGGPAANALLFHPTAIAVDNNNNIFFTDRNGDIIRKIDQAGIITTVSGQYTTACGVGDGGPLSLAQFRAISAITFDQYNNLYIADYGCNTIRKVNTSGIITTIAGNGTLGYSGDGGMATEAQLAYPCKVAVDNIGNIYIPDAQNHRIRKINTSGIITTIAGTGVQGYSGDGGLATNAEIAFPGSVVIDDIGNLYFGDYNYVIRKIDVSGTITAYAGSGIYGFSGDGGPAVLASMALTEGRISIYNNDIFFANYTQGGSGNVIRKITNCLTASINQHPQNISLCNPGSATFSINTINTTGYQWQLNTGTGWIDITDNSVYAGTTSNSLTINTAATDMNNFRYRCRVLNECGAIFSQPATLLVKIPVSPSISISTPFTDICERSSVTFTAAIENGGSLPSYQWKKNGNNVGSNTPSYTDNSLVNADIISCTLFSNANCIATNTVFSNDIIVTVKRPESPTINISTSGSNICSGTSVTFTSSIENGGSNPTLAWFKNNVNLSLNSLTYTDHSLNNGDIITCSLTSSLSCVTATTITSSPIIMSVIPLATPSITITSSGSLVCKNTPVTFTAISENEGVSPVFQWKKNGIPVGSNTNTYTDNTLTNSDIITCLLTSNNNCITTTQVTSNTLNITLYPEPVVSLDKKNTLCEGTNRTLDAGSFTSYLWSTGATSRSIVINDIGIYGVTVKDNNGCTGSDFINISSLIKSPAGFLPKDTAICTYGSLLLKPDIVFESYLWQTGSKMSSITITQPGQYWLQAKNNAGCIGIDTIMVHPKECLKGFFMPTAFTPNNDGKNDIIKPILLGNVKYYKFYIYNRWGNLIFQSTNLLNGWDGTYKGSKQNGDVFVWMCNYQFENEAPQSKKGTFVLLK